MPKPARHSCAAQPVPCVTWLLICRLIEGNLPSCTFFHPRLQNKHSSAAQWDSLWTESNKRPVWPAAEQRTGTVLTLTHSKFNYKTIRFLWISSNESIQWIDLDLTYWAHHSKNVHNVFHVLNVLLKTYAGKCIDSSY